MPEATGQSPTITVECTCGKRLKAPATAIGRKAKCPKCGNILIVEAPPPPPEETQEELGLGFDDGALYELAANEAQHAATAEATESRCPNCARLMADGGILCTNCGYNTKTGKTIEVVKDEPPKPKKSLFGKPKTDDAASAVKKGPKDKMAPTGNFLVGIAVSSALAIAASLVWFIVAYYTDRDFYLLELLVGIAAGLGMQIGHKGFSKLGGAVAVGVTFLVLIGVRIAVVVAVLMPGVIKEARKSAAELEREQIEQRDERVATVLARDELKAKGLNPDDFDEEDEKAEWQQAQKRGQEKLKTMSQAEYEKMLPKVEQYAVREQLIWRQMDGQLRSMGLNPDFKRVEPGDYKKAHTAVAVKVDKLTPAQQKTELKKLDEQASAELHDRIAKARATGKIADEKPVGGFIAILALFLLIKPLLFMLLSMAAAYRAAAGTVTG